MNPSPVRMYCSRMALHMDEPSETMKQEEEGGKVREE